MAPGLYGLFEEAEEESARTRSVHNLLRLLVKVVRGASSLLTKSTEGRRQPVWGSNQREPTEKCPRP